MTTRPNEDVICSAVHVLVPVGLFGVDVLQCSRCQGKMRLIACMEEPDVARGILEHLGLRAEALSTLRAQAPSVTLELFPANWGSSIRARAVDDQCVAGGPAPDGLS